MTTPRKPRRQPQRKPGNARIEDRHYRDFKNRIRTSRWKTDKDGKDVAIGKRWIVHWNDTTGTPKSQSFDRQEAAKAHRTKISSELHTSTYIDARLSATQFGVMADAWKGSLAGKSGSTRLNYESILKNHVEPRWADAELRSIRFADVQKWMGEKGAQVKADGSPKLAPATLHKILQVLSNVLDFAVKDGRIGANPAVGVELPKSAPPVDRFLTDMEVSALVAAANYLHSLRSNVTRKGRDRKGELTLNHADDGQPIIPDAPKSDDGLAIRFLTLTGLRMGEFSALKVKNLDLDGRKVHVREAYADEAGKLSLGLPKGGKVRTVGLAVSLVGPLREQIEGKRANDLVFTSSTGGPIRRGNWSKRVLIPAMNLAELEPLTAPLPSPYVRQSRGVEGCPAGGRS